MVDWKVNGGRSKVMHYLASAAVFILYMVVSTTQNFLGFNFSLHNKPVLND